MHLKDEILDHLADGANVAQFVSYSPDLVQRYSRVSGLSANHQFRSIRGAADALLARSADGSVNVRSFDPLDPKSREFIYGLTDGDAVEAQVKRLASSGLYTIVNETIDIRDGGVSGVVLGDVIEFAPDDTPRCVEKPGTAAFPRALGRRLLETVYGFGPPVEYPNGTRVEFSLHPLRRGVRREHQIVWELEDVGESSAVAEIRWPNRFSELIGDKVFGLLVADLYGLPVPRTTVIARRLAPFTFGRRTGTKEPWLRTSPRVQVPGKFTTQRGWTDPFALLAKEDPEAVALASVICQEGVDASFSGAALAAETPDGPALTIEGTAGFGDEFMIGAKRRSPLPRSLTRSVERLYEKAFARFGYVRFEWVASRRRVWIVQFHRGASPSSGRTIFPGTPATYINFNVNAGLEALRALVATVSGRGEGIRLIGDVGITSHFGDVLRKAQVPSIIADENLSLHT
jgi:hypothetical protein